MEPGCFALLNTGSDMVRSRNRLLTTIAYRLDGKTTYALEGSIFMAGATVQWLRDEMGFLKAASDSGTMAARADAAQDVYLVPAFTGLGAPALGRRRTRRHFWTDARHRPQ